MVTNIHDGLLFANATNVSAGRFICEVNSSIVADRFQELDLSISAYVVSDTSQEDEWMQKVATVLSQKNKYKMVRYYCCSLTVTRLTGQVSPNGGPLTVSSAAAVWYKTVVKSYFFCHCRPVK